MSKNYLTKDGLKKIKKELEHLKTDGRREMAKRLEKAISYGDLSENAEYAEAKEAQDFLENRIFELECIVRDAVLIIKCSSGVVQVGSTVLAEYKGKQEKFEIVGAAEANPLEGRISMASPLGKAFLNKTKGAIVEIETPVGKAKYKILGIE